MLLIAAALQEEIEQALEICADRTKIAYGTVSPWKARYGGTEILFLKTGAGPVRAEERLKRLLRNFRPAFILVVGYAGALDPALRVGQLVIGQKASIFGEKPGSNLALEDLELSGTWELANCVELLEITAAHGLPAASGSLLTSPYIIGEPHQKAYLHEKYQATAVDMETAALARAALGCGIPLGCVRAVSDTSEDEFLAPFSYDPGSGPVGRAARVIAAGNWIGRCKDWRQRAAAARLSLRRFLAAYFFQSVA